MANILDKNFKSNSKDIRYIGKDFDQLKQNLIEFAKHYYPRTYKDFNEASPGMMFIDMASYVGDVLSFYIDYQYKEGLLEFAEERKNVIQLAKYLGYKTRPTKSSTTTLDVYQIIPSKRNLDGSFEPDMRYALVIKPNMSVLSSNGVNFLTKDVVDFSVKSKLQPRTDEVFSKNGSGEPEFYLLKKSVPAFSGKVITKTVTISGVTPSLNIELNETNVISILSVTDDDNNNWYQVDYLAQDLVTIPIQNNQYNFESFSEYNSTVPNIMSFLRTNRRYVVDVDENNKTSLQFGPSTDSVEEEILVPNSELLGVGFSNISKYNLTLDPTSFVKSNSYGISPINTTLTIRYIVGGGLESNSAVGEITSINGIEFEDRFNYLSSEINLINTIKNSVKTENSTPATGGKGPESILEIKQNAMANFSTQERVVTKEDYIARVLSMPPEYGSVTKVYILSESDLLTKSNKSVQGLLDENNNIILDESNKDVRKINMDGYNQFGLNLYLLTYDDNKNLTPINGALSYNLRKYLSKYRMISERVNLVDGFIINIGVDFDITTFSNYNKKEILVECNQKVIDFFDIEQWQFSQPINLSALRLEISNVEGVRSISNLKIKNLIGNGYSIYEYDINSATKNDIIYPPIDPSVFEVKYPDIDIRGRVL